MKYLLLAALAALSGCSTLFGDSFRDRADDYLTTTPSKEAKGLDGEPLATGDSLPIPVLPQDVEQPGSFELPRPERLVLQQEEVPPASASLNDFSNRELNTRLDRDGSGSRILRLDVNFAEAWAEVTEALTASDLRLVDLNRSLATWYLELDVVPAEDNRGWWAKLWNSEPEAESSTYLLKLNKAHNGVYLALLADVDKLADDTLAESVFTEIKKQLDQ